MRQLSLVSGCNGRTLGTSLYPFILSNRMTLLIVTTDRYKSHAGVICASQLALSVKGGWGSRGLQTVVSFILFYILLSCLNFHAPCGFQVQFLCRCIVERIQVQLPYLCTSSYQSETFYFVNSRNRVHCHCTSVPLRLSKLLSFNIEHCS